MIERMTRIASKGLAFEKIKPTVAADSVIKTAENIDFNEVQGWTLAKDYSRDNILSLNNRGSGLNRKSTRKLSLFSPPSTSKFVAGGNITGF